MRNSNKIIIVIIALFVGLLHFVIGHDYQGTFRNFLQGYMIDILLPFSLFLLFGLTKHPVLKSPYTRGLILFLVGMGVEILQYYGNKILGQTADLLDIVAYASGIISAALFEHFVLSKYATQKK